MEFMKEIDIVGVISGQSSLHMRMLGRQSHTFVYKISGESEYTLRGKRILHKAGTLIYIPEGESYSLKRVVDGTYRLINFHARCDSLPEPRLFAQLNGDQIALLMEKMESIWSHEQGLADRYEMVSLFYKMLSHLEGLRQGEYITSERLKKIAPAVSYLETHLFDVQLKVSTLYALCALSPPAFRQIFVARFGMPPRQYIIERRIRQAMLMLESGEYRSVLEVAHAVGYEDPLYFSKCFKAVCGYAPSKFKAITID